MKKKLLCLSALALVAGCFSPHPYEHLENWLIREDPVRMFAVPADIFYVQGDLFTKKASVPMMADYAQMEVGNKKFHGVARVFSPLIASAEDLEEALNWYFKYHHEGHRPFIFIGEGEGGRLLREYEENGAEDLKKKGLVASFYTDDYRKGFVTAETVGKVKRAIERARFREIWGREMPEDMLSK